MGLVSLLKDMQYLTDSLSGVSSIMKGLGSIGRDIGSSLGKAFDAGAKIASNALKDIKKALEPISQEFRILWDSIVMPIWDLMKESAMLAFNVLTGNWIGALNNIKNIWDGSFGIIWNDLKIEAGLALKGLETLWDNITGSMNTIWDNTVGGVFDVLFGSAITRFNEIKNAWDIVSTEMKDIYEKELGDTFDRASDSSGILYDIPIVGDALRIGKAVDAVTGGAASGGVNNAFNMTFNLSGLTDRTDKRELAREISDLVQQEMSRGIGGVGRGR
jgi:hypothetical protein